MPLNLEFKTKKNYYMANGAATLAAIFYFVVNLITLQVDLNKATSNPPGYSFFLWLIIILPLTILFRRLQFKFTPKDSDRDNFDFSE